MRIIVVDFTINSMTLCPFCEEIPDTLFGSKPEYANSVLRSSIPHVPILWLKNSASLGCPLCKVLASGIGGGDFLTPEEQATIPTNLRLASIDAEQGLNICVGLDDINHVFYYFVPPNLCM